MQVVAVQSIFKPIMSAGWTKQSLC